MTIKASNENGTPPKYLKEASIGNGMVARPVVIAFHGTVGRYTANTDNGTLSVRLNHGETFTIQISAVPTLAKELLDVFHFLTE